MPEPHVTVDHWRDLLQREIVLRPRARTLPLAEAVGRCLAEAVHSPEDLPAAPIAAMDGFAVRSAELTAPGRTTMPVTAELPARPGDVPALVPGSAARIMTGALVPAGADTVIEVEASDADPFGPVPAHVTFDLAAPLPARRHVREVGEEIARGALLAAAGERIGPGLVGLARALGIGEVAVLDPPRVAVVVTGDELTGDELTGAPAGAVPGAPPGGVRESNGAMLAAALQADGAVSSPPLRCGDAPEQLRAALREAAASADLVLTTGGIGHGAFDVVKLALGAQGSGTSRFAHLALRPGGPQGWGRLESGVPVVHLPGTPVGALVGYHLFVRPLLRVSAALPVRMPLGEDRTGGRPLRPGTVHAAAGRLRREAAGREVVDLLPGRRLAPFARADALVLRGPESADGGPVQVLRLPG